MSRRDVQGMQKASANAIDESWVFDASIPELNALLARLLKQLSNQAADDEDALGELFGPLLSDDEVQRLLQLDSIQNVRELVRKKKLLELPPRDGRKSYPAFQFNDQGIIYPDIERIIGIFDGVVASPYTIASWLRGPKAYLGGTAPIRWLELERDPEPLIAGAEVAAARLGR